MKLNSVNKKALLRENRPTKVIHKILGGNVYDEVTDNGVRSNIIKI